MLFRIKDGLSVIVNEQGQKLCILADDEPTIRTCLGAILRKQQYIVLEAENGNEAQQLLMEHGETIDLVVSDFKMCGGDGFRLVVMARETFPELPIILMSGYFAPEGDGLRDVEFLLKPFAIETLLNAIENASVKVEHRSKRSPDDER